MTPSIGVLYFQERGLFYDIQLKGNICQIGVEFDIINMRRAIFGYFSKGFTQTARDQEHVFRPIQLTQGIVNFLFAIYDI